jgi:hypothetical protein
MAAKAKAGRAGGLSKMEAVRRALAELGRDAKPAQLRAFVKERFGIEMTADHVSTYKGQILRKEKEGGPTTPPATKEPPARQAAPTPPVRATPKAAAVSLADIAAVKGLVGRVGAESLKQLIDLLAR